MALLAAPAVGSTVRLPTLTVECQFAPGTWTDISEWVLTEPGRPAFTFNRGRPDEFTALQPSHAAVLLDNADGRFTSGNAASQYSPNVRPGVPIRFSYVWSSVPYTRWTGFVDEWPTAWPGGSPGLSEVQVTCTDRLARLGRLGALRPVLSEEVLYDSPTAYYPLTGPEGPQGDIAGRGMPALEVRRRGYVGSIEYQSSVGPPSDDASSVKLTRAADANTGRVDGFYLTGAGAYAGAAAVRETFSLELWFSAVADANNPTMTLAWLGTDELNYYLLRTTSLTGRLQAVARGQGFTIGSVDSSSSVVDGRVHHAVLTVEPSAGAGNTLLRLYLDGAAVGSIDAQPAINAQLRKLTAGMDTYRHDTTDPIGAFNGGLAHLAVYPTVLTPARIAEHYEAGATGFAGEPAEDRFGRWARLAGISGVATEAGGGLLGAQQSDGQAATSLLEEVAAVEQGVMFVDGHGQLVMHTRAHRHNQASQASLPADGKRDLQFVADDQYLTNDATYGRPGGVPQRHVDEASADPDTGYGRYADVRTLPYLTDEQAYSAAVWRTATYATPKPRLSSVTVDLLAEPGPAVVASVLNLDVGSRFTVTGLPAQAPAASVELIAEGLSETLGVDVWQVGFNTSPGSYYGPAWILDDPVYSNLGVTTVLAS